MSGAAPPRRSTATRASRRRTMLVVGGGGRMGRLLVRSFAARRWVVLVNDPNGAPPGLQEAALDAASSVDVVVNAAALSRAREVHEAILDHGPEGLLLDIASVKAPLMPAIERARRQEVTVASLHPMFGPDVRSFRGRDVIVCDAGSAVAARQASELFEGTGAVLRQMPLNEHDAWVARTMGLAHLAALALGSALRTCAVDVGDLRGRASTSFRRLVELIRPILEQGPELTYAIQHENPETPFVLERLEEELRALRGLLLAGDEPVFEGWVKEVRQHVLGNPRSRPARRQAASKPTSKRR